MRGVLRMKIIKLNKAFKYTPTENKGIFYYLAQLQNIDLPWNESNITSQLDYYYHLNNSGGKIVSPLIDSFLYEDEIPTENLSDIAAIIYSLFGQTWLRLWEIYNAEYNPINNYDMEESSSDVETLEHGKTTTRTDRLKAQTTNDLTDEDTYDTTDTRTPDLTNTETPQDTHTINKSKYGFNSTDPVPDEVIEEENGGQLTVTQTGDETYTKEGTMTKTRTGTQTLDNTGTQTFADGGVDTKRNTHTLLRSGNIGVTTSQQMIQSEIDLWKWNYFKNVVFPNIDGVLTIQMY